jgi:hypothetical protein
VIEDELVFLVVAFLKIQQDSSGLEHGEIIPGTIDEGRDPSVRIQFEEPRLLLDVLPELNLFNAETT